LPSNLKAGLRTPTLGVPFGHLLNAAVFSQTEFIAYGPQNKEEFNDRYNNMRPQLI